MTEAQLPSSPSPAILDRLRRMFAEPQIPPEVIFATYWARVELVQQVRDNHGLGVERIAAEINKGKRTIEYMLTVGERISPAERDGYLDMARAAGLTLTTKVLEIIASCSEENRRLAFNEWATERLTVRGLEAYVQRLTGKSEQTAGGKPTPQSPHG